MKLSGSAMLHAPAQQIFDSMQDPKFLVRTIPGCQQLQVVGPDEYQMTISAGVASIKGTYLGNVRMVDPDPPQAYTLKASAQSAVGTVDADARIRLEDRGDGSTELQYDADASIGGTIAGVGQRVLTGVARKMAGEFFAAVDRELINGEPGLATSLPPVPPRRGPPRPPGRRSRRSRCWSASRPRAGPPWRPGRRRRGAADGRGLPPPGPAAPGGPPPPGGRRWPPPPSARRSR